MPKRERVPKPRVPPVSAAALRLFQRGRQIQRLGRAEMPESGPMHRLTREYRDTVNALRKELGLEFSDFNPLECPDKQPTQLQHLCIVQSWPKINRIRLALEAADRESRARRKAVGESDGGPRSQEKRISGPLMRPAAARTAAARRQRRRRELVKAGLARFTIAADADRLAGYLIDTGRISEDEAREHCAVEAALAVLVADLVDRFAEKRV
jgi:hypothetical protein